jgi:hypothetical protein
MPKLTLNTLFPVLAFVLFVIAALVAGGVISMSGGGWLLPGGPDSLTLAMLLP